MRDSQIPNLIKFESTDSALVNVMPGKLYTVPDEEPRIVDNVFRQVHIKGQTTTAALLITLSEAH